MSALSPEQLAKAAAFYGIDLKEAERRQRVLQEHGDDPTDPICVGCARRASEMPELDSFIQEIDGFLMDGPPPTPEDRRRYVLREEGTLNPRNGHFLCDTDYVRNGMPSSPGGWICP